MIAAPAHAQPDAPARIPPVTMIAALIAFWALTLSEGGSILLIGLGAALIATYLIPSRWEPGSRTGWIARIVLFTAVFLINGARGETGEMTARWALFGDLCAAELVIQAWRRWPSGGGGAAVALSGLIFVAASNTLDDRSIPLLTPPFILFFVLSLRYCRAQPHFDGGKRLLGWHSVRASALSLVLLLGGGANIVFRYYSGELSDLGRRLLNETPRPQTAGLSTTPILGATFNIQGTPTRVLRIEGTADVSHLRALAYADYARGAWRPSRENRQYAPVAPPELRPDAPGDPVRITRLIENEGMLFAPLNMAGLSLTGQENPQWAREEGGPIRTETPAPSAYALRVGPEGHQGPLCAPPDTNRRQRLLSVPPEVDPGVRKLAQQIAGNRASTPEKIEAVVHYLLTNHRYSLRTRPTGDPVSSFLLQKKSAHCEYFASAATILLRCLGVPSRYVVGYYAHEGEGSGVTIVRERDAHAWAESWVDGFGWVTVEATPGDGRPDQTNKPISPLTRLIERLEDTFRGLREGLRSENGKRAVVGFFVVVISIWLAQWLGQRYRPRVRSSGTFAYAAAEMELSALLARFEALCRRARLVCPPGRPWLEHLAVIATAERPPALDLENAMAFLRAYNAARFGGRRDDTAFATLREQLTTLERDATKGEYARGVGTGR